MGIGGLRTHITTVPAEFLVKVAMQSCQKERQELSSVMVNGGLPPSIATPMLADVDRGRRWYSGIESALVADCRYRVSLPNAPHQALDQRGIGAGRALRAFVARSADARTEPP
jgi:hypothetical protein